MPLFSVLANIAQLIIGILVPITNRPSSPVTLIPKLQPHLLQQLLVALAFAPAAFAQSAPPTSGSQGQQIPQIPSLPRPAPNIGLPAPLAPAAAASAASAANQTSFPLQTLRLTGNRILGEAELLQASGFAPGSYTLAQLQVLAQKITAAYQARGYFVAQAYVPKQDIAGGVATIAVVEGQYGKITVRNASKLSPRVVNAIVSGLEKGDAVNVAPLERRLLALSDLPGISVKSTLAPGEEAGSSDLSIDIQDAQSITGSVDADNQGGRYTGAIRMGATVNLNNAAGLGDVASLRAFTSGSGLSYARASYQAPVGMGTLGVAYSSLGYKLGKEFAALQASGSARTTSLYGSYPLIRSRSRNLNLQLGLDTKTFQDKQDATASLIDKKSRVWTLSVSGSARADGSGVAPALVVGVDAASDAFRVLDVDAEIRAASFFARGQGGLDGNAGQV